MDLCVQRINRVLGGVFGRHTSSHLLTHGVRLFLGQTWRMSRARPEDVSYGRVWVRTGTWILYDYYDFIPQYPHTGL
jgi:hypothetical protein